MLIAEATANQPPNSLPRTIARIISWIGHPLVLVSVTVGIIVFLRLSNPAGLLVLSALILSVILPMALLLIRGVRSGRWSDADVSVHGERRRFYPSAILVSAGGVAFLLVLPAPPFIVRGAAVTLGLLLFAAALNRYRKLSLHTMFAFYCALILLRINWSLGAAAFALAGAIIWSRLYLRRHAFIDIILGLILGSTGAVVVAWWP